MLPGQVAAVFLNEDLTRYGTHSLDWTRRQQRPVAVLCLSGWRRLVRGNDPGEVADCDMTGALPWQLPCSTGASNHAEASGWFLLFALAKAQWGP